MVSLPPPQPITIALKHMAGAKDKDKQITAWRYCFMSQFLRIINNQKLMRSENIICNCPIQPYHMYTPSKKIDESQDRYLYQNAMKHLCINVDNNFVVGVDINADSAWCNVLGRNNYEPSCCYILLFQMTYHTHSQCTSDYSEFISDMDHKSSAEGN